LPPPKPVSTATPGAAPLYGYVTNGGDGTVSVFDPAANKVVATINGFVVPGAAAANVNTPYVYVTDFFLARAFAIDSRTNAVTQVAGGCALDTVSMRPTGNIAYVGAACSNTLDYINTTTNADQRVTVPDYNGFTSTAYVYPNPSDPLLYMAGQNGVLVYDETKKAITADIGEPVGVGALVANPSGTQLYVAANTVQEINTATNTITASVPIGATALAFNPATNLLYATSRDKNQVAIVDTTRMAITGYINVGKEPIGIALNAAGTRGYVANYADDTVSVFDLKTNAVVATFAVGAHPASVVLRDAGISNASCSGRPTLVRVTPDSSAHFVFALANGYRLVGPQAQQFDLTAIDCNGMPVSGAAFTATIGPGVTINPPVNGTLTLTASQPLAAPVQLLVTANSPQGSIQTSLSIEASPAIYETTNGGTVYVWDDHGNIIPQPSAAFSGLPGAAGLAYNAADGRLYVALDDRAEIDVFDLSGNVQSTIRNAALNNPVAIAFNTSGTTMFVANAAFGSSPPAGSVVALSTSGVLQSAVGAFPGLAQPLGVAYDSSSGHVLVTDNAAKALLTFDSAGTALTTTPLNFQPEGLMLDPDTGVIYIMNGNGNAVAEFSNLIPAGSLSGQFDDPMVAAFDSFNRRIYIANYQTMIGPGTQIPEIASFDEQGNSITYAPENGFMNGPVSVQGLTVVP
jgi:YVTN family beta-propeller protein